MARFSGLLSTDVYNETCNEARLAHWIISATEAVAADADGILNDTALGTGVTKVTTFLAQPPYPRNITIVASDAQSGKATVYGTNIADQAISEELTIDGTTPVLGAKAFKTVTSISLPIKAGSETVDVGWGDKLGLPFMSATAHVMFAALDKVIETTAPTQVADADEIEKNTVDLNSALDGHVVDLYFFMD